MDRAPDFGSVGSGFDSWLGHLNIADVLYSTAIYRHKKDSIKWRPFLLQLPYSYSNIREASVILEYIGVDVLPVMQDEAAEKLDVLLTPINVSNDIKKLEESVPLTQKVH